MSDVNKEPCPWRVVDAAGAGFMMGYSGVACSTALEEP